MSDHLAPLTGSAHATEGFTCPEGSTAVEVPYAWTADNVPLLAGTVCVYEETTTLQSLDVNAPWHFEVKSSGGSKGVDVRFTNPETRDRVELIYEPGQTEIKN
jgi:hypothetical protein